MKLNLLMRGGLIASAVAVTGMADTSAQNVIVYEVEPMEAPMAVEPETEEEAVLYSAGPLQFIPTASNAFVYKTIKEARPKEPGGLSVPKFTVKSKNNKFMMTIGGKINPIMGYDIGNDLYQVTDAGSSFIPGDIPVPPLTGHKGDFFINALNGNLDFTIVGFAGTKNQVTGYIKIAANGNTKPIVLKRAFITWHNVSAGLKSSNATDDDACQPNLIDPQGPNGDVSTSTYQVSYLSPSYNGFRFAASIEKPTFNNSNGIYRGKDFASWYGHQVNADVDQLIPDIPLWMEYSANDQNRVRFTAILRNFAYQNMLEQKRQNIFAWGTMLSGNFSFWKPLTFNFQAVYGKGIGAYIQDLQGRPVSFTPDSEHLGKMQANPMMGLVFGASYNATKKLQFNVVGSYARIWNVGDYATFQDATAEDANGHEVMTAGDANYHYGIYVAANCFYKFTPYLQWGIEYLYGRRATYSLGAANDSRIQTQLTFTF